MSVNRRLRVNLMERFKSTHNIYKLSDSLLQLGTRTNTSDHSYKEKKQKYNTTFWQHFFTQRIVDRWNSLPAEVAEAPSSLNAFKNRVDIVTPDYMYS